MPPRWIDDGSQHLLGYMVGSTYMTYDGEYSSIDQPPVIVNGRAYLPARDLIEKLGGTVIWHPDLRRVDIDYQKPTPGKGSARSVRAQSCAVHGYTDYENCPSGQFFLPEMYNSFGFNSAKDLIIGGANLEPAYVYHFNRIAMMHEGNPPRSEKEAAILTVDQFIADVSIAEFLGLFWVLTPPNESSGRTMMGAATKPTKTGWAVPPGGQSMSQDAIAFQARVSGQSYRLVRLGRSNVHVWEIQEYGYVTSQNTVWFDSFKNSKLIDAKAIPLKWIGPNGQFTQFHASTTIQTYAEQARRQISIVGGEWPIQWQFDSQAALDAWMGWLRNEGAWDILENIEFIVGPK